LGRYLNGTPPESTGPQRDSPTSRLSDRLPNNDGRTAARTTAEGGVGVNLAGDDLHAAYYCAAEVTRSRRRTGQPIPAWLRRHYDSLDAEIRVSDLGRESDGDTGQLDQDTLITAREAALIIGCSKRQAQRLAAADLGGQIIGGRWLVKLSAVMEYMEGKRRG